MRNAHSIGTGVVRHTDHPPRLFKSFSRHFATLMVVLLALSGLVTGSTAAFAATTATIDSVKFQHSEFPGGSMQDITVAWSAPDNPSTPLTVEVALPPQLQGNADSFPAIGPNGDAIGSCVVTATKVSCTIDDEFVRANPIDISGSFTFAALVKEYNSQTEEHTYDFGGVKAPPVTVTPNPDVCTRDCDFNGWHNGFKLGDPYDNTTDQIKWTVYVPAPADGMPAGQQVNVKDHLDPALFEVVGDPVVRESSTMRRSPTSGREFAVLENMPTSLYTVSADKTSVSFTTRGQRPSSNPKPGDRVLTGTVYAVDWVVHVKDQGKAGPTRTPRASRSTAKRTPPAWPR